MGRYFVFFLLFLFHYYSVVFVLGGRQTRVSRPPIGWWGPCVVLRCWENPTHIAKPVSLSLSSFYLFFLFLIFRYTTTHTPPIFFSLFFFFFSFPFSMCVLAGWLAALYILQLRNDRRTKNAGLWWMRVPSAPSLALKRTWMGKINDERAQATLIPFSFLSLSLFSRCCEPKPTLLNSPF